MNLKLILNRIVAAMAQNVIGSLINDA